MYRISFAAVLAFSFMLGDVAESSAVASAAVTQAVDPLLGAPQDLTPFAEKLGLNTVLLSPDEQKGRNARSDALFFGPWQRTIPSVKAKAFRDGMLSKARGFHMNTPWTQTEWREVLARADMTAYPTPQGAGIVTRHTDIRLMPTEQPLYLEGTPEPAMDFFDFFQLSSLALGTPVYISHASTDGKWLYVEYPLLSGWARAADIARVSRAFRTDWLTGKYGVVVRDNLSLRNAAGEVLGMAHIGSVFPLLDDGRVLIPRRNEDGTARAEAILPEADTVLPKPLPLTVGNLALLGNRMMGQPYRWGGSDHMRDCSLATRDLFLPFGVWLPRNSRSQVNTSTFKKLTQLTPQARKAAIVREGKPFMTLIGFPGHVGLYVGTLNGEPIMLHNIMGLRTDNPDEFFRRIVGKCNLSTLEPGKDDPEVQLSESLLERVQAIRHLQ